MGDGPPGLSIGGSRGAEAGRVRCKRFADEASAPGLTLGRAAAPASAARSPLGPLGSLSARWSAALGAGRPSTPTSTRLSLGSSAGAARSRALASARRAGSSPRARSSAGAAVGAAAAGSRGARSASSQSRASRPARSSPAKPAKEAAAGEVVAAVGLAALPGGAVAGGGRQPHSRGACAAAGSDSATSPGAGSAARTPQPRVRVPRVPAYALSPRPSVGDRSAASPARQREPRATGCIAAPAASHAPPEEAPLTGWAAEAPAAPVGGLAGEVPLPAHGWGAAAAPIRPGGWEGGWEGGPQDGAEGGWAGDWAGGWEGGPEGGWEGPEDWPIGGWEDGWVAGGSQPAALSAAPPPALAWPHPQPPASAQQARARDLPQVAQQAQTPAQQRRRRPSTTPERGRAPAPPRRVARAAAEARPAGGASAARAREAAATAAQPQLPLPLGARRALPDGLGRPTTPRAAAASTPRGAQPVARRAESAQRARRPQPRVGAGGEHAAVRRRRASSVSTALSSRPRLSLPLPVRASAPPGGAEAREARAAARPRLSARSPRPAAQTPQTETPRPRTELALPRAPRAAAGAAEQAARSAAGATGAPTAAPLRAASAAAGRPSAAGPQRAPGGAARRSLACGSGSSSARGSSARTASTRALTPPPPRAGSASRLWRPPPPPAVPARLLAELSASADVKAARRREAEDAGRARALQQSRRLSSEQRSSAIEFMAAKAAQRRLADEEARGAGAREREAREAALARLSRFYAPRPPPADASAPRQGAPVPAQAARGALGARPLRAEPGAAPASPLGAAAARACAPPGHTRASAAPAADWGAAVGAEQPDGATQLSASLWRIRESEAAAMRRISAASAQPARSALGAPADARAGAGPLSRGAGLPSADRAGADQPHSTSGRSVARELARPQHGAGAERASCPPPEPSASCEALRAQPPEAQRHARPGLPAAAHVAALTSEILRGCLHLALGDAAAPGGLELVAARAQPGGGKKSPPPERLGVREPRAEAGAQARGSAEGDRLSSSPASAVHLAPATLRESPGAAPQGAASSPRSPGSPRPSSGGPAQPASAQSPSGSPRMAIFPTNPVALSPSAPAAHAADLTRYPSGRPPPAWSAAAVSPPAVDGRREWHSGLAIAAPLDECASSSPQSPSPRSPQIRRTSPPPSLRAGEAASPFSIAPYASGRVHGFPRGAQLAALGAESTGGDTAEIPVELKPTCHPAGSRHVFARSLSDAIRDERSLSMRAGGDSSFRGLLLDDSTTSSTELAAAKSHLHMSSNATGDSSKHSHTMATDAAELDRESQSLSSELRAVIMQLEQGLVHQLIDETASALLDLRVQNK